MSPNNAQNDQLAQARIATTFRDLAGTANKLNPLDLFYASNGTGASAPMSKMAQMKADNAAKKQGKSAEQEVKLVQDWSTFPGINFQRVVTTFHKLKTPQGRIRGACLLLELALKEERLADATDVALCLAKLEKLATLSEDDKKTLKHLYKKLGKLYKNAAAEADKKDEEEPDPIAMQFMGQIAMAPANPFSRDSFEGLDPWQHELLARIFATGFTESFLVMAATGAGKTRISVAVCQKLAQVGKKTVFIVPSNPVAWQVAGYLRDLSIPIKLAVDGFEYEERDWTVVVGTPAAVEVMLQRDREVPYSYAVYDEIHSLDAPMERLMYMLACPFVALSATLSRAEAERIAQFWSERLGHRVGLFEHNQRYINLSRHVWQGGRLKKMHPLATLTVQDIRAGAFDKMSLGFTPSDCWELSVALHNLDIEVPSDAVPEEFFRDHREHIHLDDVKKIEERMKLALVGLSDNVLERILRVFRVDLTQLTSTDGDLLPMALKLKEKNMTPVVIFSQNPADAAEHFVHFTRKLESEQDRVYPDYQEQLVAKARLFKDYEARRRALAASKVGRGTRFPTGMDLERALQQFDREEEDKQMQGLGQATPVDLDEPHPDYSFSRGIVKSTIDEVKAELKEAFGIAVGTQSAVISGLVRGVGVITGDMSTEQQLIVQKLVQKGYVRVLFADRTWAYGVNMPFRTAVLMMDGDISPLLAQQMEGRAGRRGYDFEGHVVYIGSNPTPLLKREYGQVTGAGNIWCHAIPSLPSSLGMRLRGESLGGLNEFISTVKPSLTLYKDKNWNNNRELKTLLWALRNSGERVLHVPELLERITEVNKTGIKELTIAFSIITWIVEGNSTSQEVAVPNDVRETVQNMLSPIGECNPDSQLISAFLNNTYGNATRKERTELNIRMQRIQNAGSAIYTYQGRKTWKDVVSRIAELVKKNTIIHSLE